VKSEFWALYHGDVDDLGWTLHFMTPELDGGDIVLRGGVPWNGENPAALRAKLLRDAVPAIATLLRRVGQEGVAALSRTPQGPGRYFTTPTLADWRHQRQSLGAARGVVRSG